MKLKKRWILWLGLILLSWPVCAQTQNKVLRLYMPRTIKIKGAMPTLGQIVILRGPDELVSRLRSVPMGRISSPGGQVVIDRNTILSRLASHGIKTSDVTLSGAEKTVVQQESITLASAILVKEARAALKDFPMIKLVNQVTLTRAPAPIILPGAEQVPALKVDSIRQISANQIRVRIEVLQEDKRLAFRDVIFGLRFRVYRLVTNMDILPGTAIDHSHIRVVEGVSNRMSQSKDNALWHENADGKMVVREGLIALKTLQAGVVIRPGMIGVPAKKVLVKRRQNVVIRLENLGLMVSAMGVAQEEGRVGDVIKVRNAGSMRLIMAYVNADGSVAPVL
jgi:flagella basal body P-ring formation protein FlgA